MLPVFSLSSFSLTNPRRMFGSMFGGTYRIDLNLVMLGDKINQVLASIYTKTKRRNGIVECPPSHKASEDKSSCVKATDDRSEYEF